MKNTTWHLGYIEQEGLWYLVELHDMDGILSEDFFVSEPAAKIYCKENNIILETDE